MLYKDIKEFKNSASFFFITPAKYIFRNYLYAFNKKENIDLYIIRVKEHIDKLKKME